MKEVDKSKTPGEVAFIAYVLAFAKRMPPEMPQPDPNWEALRGKEVWHRVALAVREQTLVEIQAKLIAEERYYTKHHAGWVNSYEILTDVKRIAAAPIKVP